MPVRSEGPLFWLVSQTPSPVPHSETCPWCDTSASGATLGATVGGTAAAAPTAPSARVDAMAAAADTLSRALHVTTMS